MPTPNSTYGDMSKKRTYLHDKDHPKLTDAERSVIDQALHSWNDDTTSNIVECCGTIAIVKQEYHVLRCILSAIVQLALEDNAKFKLGHKEQYKCAYHVNRSGGKTQSRVADQPVVLGTRSGKDRSQTDDNVGQSAAPQSLVEPARSRSAKPIEVKPAGQVSLPLEASLSEAGTTAVGARGWSPPTKEYPSGSVGDSIPPPLTSAAQSSLPAHMGEGSILTRDLSKLSRQSGSSNLNCQKMRRRRG